MDYSRSEDHCPPGDSGPRRSTRVPQEIAAAHAEGARMADEQRVSSSVRLLSGRSRENKETGDSASASFGKKVRSFKLVRRSSIPKEHVADAYQVVPPDGRVTGIGLMVQNQSEMSGTSGCNGNAIPVRSFAKGDECNSRSTILG
jgi:hypothetical protein